METFTVMMPAASVRRHDLALLHAPVYAAPATPATPAAHASGEPAGRSEGVVLDEVGCVTAFIVRLQPHFAAGSPILLLPATAVAHTDGGALHLSWSAERILALPRLDEELRPLEPIPTGTPALAPSSVTGPRRQSGGNAGAQGVEWGAAGAALGAVGGMILGGPLGALALAAFLAAGGAMAGAFVSVGGVGEARGGGQPRRPSRDLRPEAIRRLDDLLRDPTLVLTGLVHATRVLPMETSPAT